MHYTQEMILHSDSGYCMPFEERNGEVTMSLGYGKQKHPHTGESFFHHGVDFKVTDTCILLCDFCLNADGDHKKSGAEAPHRDCFLL